MVVMRYKVCVAIFILLIIQPMVLISLKAQTLPLNTLQQNLTGESTKPIEVALPNPLQLEARWWSYFDQKTDTVKRIEDFLQQANSHLDVLNPETRLQAEAQLKKINANLTTYAQWLSKVAVPSQPLPDILEHYNIFELVDFIGKITEISNKIQQEQLEIVNDEKRIKESVVRVDTLMAAYLKMNNNDAQKLLSGLEIIALRTELAVLEQKNKWRKEENTQRLEYLQALEKYREVAIERLSITAEEKKALDKAIDQAEEVLAEAQTRLTREQTAALSIVQETPDDRAVARYRAQRVLRAEIISALAELRLLALASERDLANVLVGTIHVDLTELKNTLNSRRIIINDLKQRLSGWTEANESRIPSETSNVALEEGSTFLKLISQDYLSLTQETQANLQKLQAELAQVEFIATLLEQRLAAEQGLLGMVWVKTYQYMIGIWEFVVAKLKTALFKIGGTPITALDFTRLVMIIAIAWWIAFWISKILLRIGSRGEGEKLPGYYLVARLLYYSIILLGMLVGLTAIGIDFTNLALVAGALAIGLGFGLQSILSNFVSGLILLFERSIKVGDFVELQDRGLWGEVKAINVRSTIISDNDNVDIIIPNSEFINTKILNWTLVEPTRRVRYPFRVAFGTDKELVREAVLSVVDAVPHTLRGVPGRGPSVWLVNFGEYGYEFELVVWLTPRAVKRPNAVRAAYMWAIDTALRRHEIEVPLPQRELRMREGVAPYMGTDLVKFSQEENI